MATARGKKRWENRQKRFLSCTKAVGKGWRHKKTEWQSHSVWWRRRTPVICLLVLLRRWRRGLLLPVVHLPVMRWLLAVMLRRLLALFAVVPWRLLPLFAIVLRCFGRLLAVMLRRLLPLLAAVLRRFGRLLVTMMVFVRPVFLPVGLRRCRPVMRGTRDGWFDGFFLRMRRVLRSGSKGHQDGEGSEAFFHVLLLFVLVRLAADAVKAGRIVGALPAAVRDGFLTT